MQNKKEITANWFEHLRDQICAAFENIEQEYATARGLQPSKFERKKWNRDGGGGGVMSIMRGNVFEKVGVNISTVYGEFSEEFKNKIPGAETDPSFFATGISLVAHMCSPLVPAVHFNTRYIETTKSWFGGGSDLTPMYEDLEETKFFHNSLKEMCDQHDETYYANFKKQCDEYFYLKHRNEARGIGGIFYDYLANNFDDDFAFTKDVGRALLTTYPEIVRRKMNLTWTDQQRHHQLVKRGRYVEFNLLYDRGTSFGLATGGNVEAILMSLPPEVKWP
ncbi:MAG: oxygen-dependent coproporphyrinogen oxidase [Rickettsiales bacterium]|nr:MAG: oxygen-dependent coproporphyrinogen oxidase [Rickettsiales bacterium]